MTLLFHPDDRLKEISQEITQFDESLQLLLTVMLDVAYTEQGVGLAAPQLGVNSRMIIVDQSSGDDKNELLVMVNPDITAHLGEVESQESCLSIPGIAGVVRRYAEVSVAYQTLLGERKDLKLDGRRAIITQHEIDHLNGILFIDRIKGIRKLTLRGKHK